MFLYGSEDGIRVLRRDSVIVVWCMCVCVVCGCCVWVWCVCVLCGLCVWVSCVGVVCGCCVCVWCVGVVCVCGVRVLCVGVVRGFRVQACVVEVSVLSVVRLLLKRLL